MNMVELIERLEKATGPDSTLDGNIFKAVAVGGSWWSFDGVWHLQDTDDTIAWAPPPPYTSSIDAALTLVPEGWIVFEMGQSGRDLKHGYYANFMSSTDGEEASGGAKNFAIALCIAALKARTALSEQEGVKE